VSWVAVDVLRFAKVFQVLMVTPDLEALSSPEYILVPFVETCHDRE